MAGEKDVKDSFPHNNPRFQRERVSVRQADRNTHDTNARRADSASAQSPT
jgi:hypothetical protein